MRGGRKYEQRINDLFSWPEGNKCCQSMDASQTCQIGKPHFVPVKAIQSGERKLRR